MKISVLILAKNAEATLAKCLDALRDFDELILLLNNSQDRSEELARDFQKSYPALRIEKCDFLGFGPMKRLGVSYAKNEWIMNIDADEILEKEAVDEIKNKIKEADKNEIFAVKRKNHFHGRWVKSCGWWPDPTFRIFNKSAAGFSEDMVHEKIISKDKRELKKIYLNAALKHYSYRDLSHMIEKAQKYSSLFAEQNMHKKRPSILAIISHSAWAFFRAYFLRRGFLDGFEGLVISAMAGLSNFLKYAKLREKQDELKKKDLIK